MPQLLRFKPLEGLTGGIQGLGFDKPQPPAFIARLTGGAIDADRWLYYFSLFVAVICFLAIRNLVTGRIGRTLLALRDHPLAARSYGVNTSHHKTLAFGISAGLAGVGGALGAVLVQFVSPDSYPFFFSISLVVGVIVGGLATISGAIWGALFVQFVPTIAGDISRAAPWAIYGLLLILAIYIAPNGIAGLLRRGGPAINETPLRRLVRRLRR